MFAASKLMCYDASAMDSDFALPTQVAKTLTQLTDEPRPEVALRLVVKDALKLRLGEVRRDIKRFKDKYGSEFSTFKKKWLEGKVADRYSHSVEKDFWEWEGLVSRLAVLNRLKKWV